MKEHDCEKERPPSRDRKVWALGATIFVGALILPLWAYEHNEAPPTVENSIEISHEDVAKEGALFFGQSIEKESIEPQMIAEMVLNTPLLEVSEDNEQKGQTRRTVLASRGGSREAARDVARDVAVAETKEMQEEAIEMKEPVVPEVATNEAVDITKTENRAERTASVAEGLENAAAIEAMTGLSVTATMQVEATAYTHTGNRTFSGKWPKVGLIAVDPRVIPMGTKLYVEGYGIAEAADTGGAIKGAMIDVFFDTREECILWGRRQVTIHILR
ncbi:3D domain-containing protein [Heliorestis convoluta]|uniref:3D domain-containing protein n=1 Tax=Heliorestis convoluta TaxID=356322 RepID=A0A5Q2N454_9FIRM|nr:3D domain-containing protein [Heliorestis convoluta]QGG48683.1 hypothetical protein FTV88_2590 [Heliorestis convoluta]